MTTVELAEVVWGVLTFDNIVLISVAVWVIILVGSKTKVLSNLRRKFINRIILIVV